MIRAVAAVVIAVALVCSASAAPPPRGAPGPVAAAPGPVDGADPAPSPVQSFRSVRSYADVAEPVRLRIPAIGVDSPLLRLGRAPDRTIEVPAVYDAAGWFDEGPRPGQPGPAVVLGHVDSKAGPGVFFALARLAAGTAILVDRADGSTIGFRVRRTQHVAKAAFPTDLVYAPTLEPSLRLVTCGGDFDRARSSYVDNVIVYAEPDG